MMMSNKELEKFDITEYLDSDECFSDSAFGYTPFVCWIETKYTKNTKTKRASTLPLLAHLSLQKKSTVS
jgi:hypothetical protein